MAASGSRAWASVHWSWTLEPLWVNTASGPSMPRLGTRGHDVNMMWQCDKLPSTVSCTNMLSFLLMLIWHSYRPLSLGLTELKKIMSEYFCSCPSGVTRQFSSKLSSLSKILPNIVLLSFVWTFCQCHTKPANSFFCGGIIFILIPTIFIVCEIFDKSRQLFISKIGFCSKIFKSFRIF